MPLCLGTLAFLQLGLDGLPAVGSEERLVDELEGVFEGRANREVLQVLHVDLLILDLGVLIVFKVIRDFFRNIENVSDSECAEDLLIFRRLSVSEVEAVLEDLTGVLCAVHRRVRDRRFEFTQKGVLL